MEAYKSNNPNAGPFLLCLVQTFPSLVLEVAVALTTLLYIPSYAYPLSIATLMSSEQSYLAPLPWPLADGLPSRAAAGSSGAVTTPLRKSNSSVWLMKAFLHISSPSARSALPVNDPRAPFHE